ncbi:hypothetical protein P171DRAFT_468497 [Karstenula rhodostoma CBS 690.94]|uniref:Uncharacterized protein n=1 Tax=Karstenula rhodostoma CBS 690.94 TaxID=1392251 RepID=A0A9P4PXP3_9PLEO|nr:hypothetical protein P171DRAFT_468497 [Karstenula rhodostoma CBS 690.94]
MSLDSSDQINQSLDDARRNCAANTSRFDAHQGFERRLQIMRSLDAYSHHSKLVREIIITGHRLERRKSSLHAEKEQAPRHTPMRRALRQQIRDLRQEMAMMKDELTQHREKAAEARNTLEALGLSDRDIGMVLRAGANR